MGEKGRGENMSQQEEIIVRELDKNPDIHITDLELMTGLPIGEVYKLRYLWRQEKKREGKRWYASAFLFLILLIVIFNLRLITEIQF